MKAFRAPQYVAFIQSFRAFVQRNRGEQQCFDPRQQNREIHDVGRGFEFRQTLPHCGFGVAVVREENHGSHGDGRFFLGSPQQCPPFGVVPNDI